MLDSQKEKNPINNNSSKTETKTESQIFKYAYSPKDKYYEIYNDKNNIQIIFRDPQNLNAINANTNTKDSNDLKDLKKNINKFNEITLIFDYESLSLELDTQELQTIISNIYSNISKKKKLNLFIQNTCINPEKNLTQLNNTKNKTIKLNKLEISDELYSFSGKLHYLFENVQVNELTLKQFKFNSKSQLENFTKFIIRTNCKKLTLDDIFIELLIKEDKDDDEYNALDIYFTYMENSIILNNTYTNIESLTLKDCSLFDITKNIFKKRDPNEDIIKIHIDENSLLNPSIITKFKIEYNKNKNNYEYEICFDLDTFKLKLEAENNDANYTFIDYLKYIFKIIISFESEEQKIKINENDGVGEIDKNSLYSLTFKNFDTTKYEFITNDDLTFIDENNWVFNDKEEIQRKEKWELFVNELVKFEFKRLSNVKKLIFDNCSYFFIEWILYFITGKINNLDKCDSPIEVGLKENDFDFEFLKLKKCAKDYVNLDVILDLKIKELILFDVPLIKSKELKDYKGSIDDLTIKINSLESYGKDYNLNTCETYEILIQLIKDEKYKDTSTTFEFNALSSIMTYLAYTEYLKNRYLYESEDPKKMAEYPEKKIDKDYKEVKYEKNLPLCIYFGSFEKRSLIYHKCFDLKLPDSKRSKIILKNIVIRKNYENFEYFTKISEDKNKNPDDKKDKNYYKTKKLDFGSDGFYTDIDYKNFIIQNKINPVRLNNVNFSNYVDSTLKSYDKETVINFISEDGENIIKNYINGKRYIMDVKTLNSIVYKNYLFEDVGALFRYYLYKIDNTQINEKTKLVSNYFDFLINYFTIFDENNELNITIKNDKEFKEVFCTFLLLEVLLLNKNLNDKSTMNHFSQKINLSLIKENFNEQSTRSYSNAMLGDENNKIILPDKKLLERTLGNYFLQEKDAENNNNLIYSSFNYYYTGENENKIRKDGSVQIFGKKYFLEINTD